jgi:hypothetical protein
MEEKVSDCARMLVGIVEEDRQRHGGPYGVVDDILGASVVVYVNGDAAQGGDLGGKLIKASVVLALALVGFGHVGLWYLWEE